MMMTTISKFYDTCSLLKRVDNLFEEGIGVYISSITLKELEMIKTSSNKDVDVKYAARKLLHVLDENSDKYETIIFKSEFLNTINEKDLPITDDMRILSCAIKCKEDINSNVIFVTNDLSLKTIASLFFDKEHIESVEEDFSDGYAGHIKITLSEDAMAMFYSHPEMNLFDMCVNQYATVWDESGNMVDVVYWDGDKHQHVNFNSFDSMWFGKVKPISTDPYQLMVCDSFKRNKITMVKGPAGSGKTYLSLGFLMSQLEHGKIDKIIVFCNTIATKNSAKLGFYPGSRDEKLLDSQIGNLLISKLGGRLAVEKMIEEEQLVLLPFSDIRGYDTNGMHAGIYISEAQNLDISLMKLALQRIGEDSICIIDGDERTQVDDIAFAGANNGMRRVSKVFRGEDIYGEIELQQIHRSRIASIAERM